MELLLQNYEKEAEVLNLKTKERYSNKPDVKTCGWYKFLEADFSALFYDNSFFTICFNNKRIQINDKCRASVERFNKWSTFKLSENGNIVFSFNYIHESDQEIPDSNLFGFIEEEDFDWGLFLMNVINNKDRQENIIRNILKR